MTIYSIIRKSQLEGAHRLDAEYYQPEYFIDFTKGKWKSIGTILEVCQYGISKAMNEESIGYPIYRMDDIKDAFLVDEDLKFANITETEAKVYKLEKNDVLFNRVNSEEFVGRTGIFKLPDFHVFASYLIRLRVQQNSGVAADYLNIFLNSEYGIRQIRKFRRRAVNQANVNAEELKKIQIALISESEQRTVETLSNQSWEQYERAKKLYQQAESLLLEELGLKENDIYDDLSYVAKLSHVKQTHRLDAEYFQPKFERLMTSLQQYNPRKLSDLVTVKKGFEPGSEEYFEDGELFIRVSSMTKFGLSDRDQKYLSDEMHQKLRNDFEPKTGEILLTKDATPGVAYVLKEKVEGIISGGILRLKPKTEIDPEYLALCLNSLVGQMQAERDSGGSVIAHWKPEQIKDVLIPVLPAATQRKLSELVIQSHEARKKAKELLEEAKRKVEEMIEAGNGK